jgi:hypothetical protein
MTVERITVGLHTHPAGELARLVTATGMTKADLVNRAIVLYARVHTRVEAGDDLVLRPAAGGEVERVWLL